MDQWIGNDQIPLYALRLFPQSSINRTNPIIMIFLAPTVYVVIGTLFQMAFRINLIQSTPLHTYVSQEKKNWMINDSQDSMMTCTFNKAI